jgi:hypothetical protein
MHNLFAARLHVKLEATMALFRIPDDGQEARRLTVQLDRVSGNGAETIRGFVHGEGAIASDMSTWNRYDQVRLQ